ncbi:MAG: hypothetical protein ACI9E1_002043 [Cryomorphaceae bacterium]|jgi:hypothetical protein
MLAKIFLTPVSKPDSEGLRYLLSLLLTKGLVEVDGLLPLSAASFVVMRIPVGAGQTDAAVDFLDERLTH